MEGEQQSVTEVDRTSNRSVLRKNRGRPRRGQSSYMCLQVYLIRDARCGYPRISVDRHTRLCSLFRGTARFELSRLHVSAMKNASVMSCSRLMS